MKPGLANFLTALFAATALLGCGRNTPLVVSVPTTAQVNEFVSKAGVSLPASANASGWRESRGMDDALWLKVEMPVLELDTFLKVSPFSDGGLATNQQHDVYNFKDFLPVLPAKFRSGQKSLPNVKTLNMLIDDSNPTNAVVYMMWFEM